MLVLLLCLCSLAVTAQPPDEPRVKAIKSARPAVVSIRAYKNNNSKPAVGSGIVMRSDGFILTNAHVVSEAKVVRVTMSGGQQYNAKIWKVDKGEDLALLKVDATGLPVARMGNSDKVQLGQTAIAIGDPQNFAGTITVGVVSAVGREIKANGVTYKSMMQTDAAINPGSSGGALIDLEGKVIGINTLIYSGRNAQGLGFAIPMNHALKVAKGMVASRPVGTGKAWLGITGQNLTRELSEAHGVPARRGVMVVSVVPGSPAELSNVMVSDAITAVDNKTVLNVPDFVNIISGYKPGDTIALTLWRMGKKTTVQVTLDVSSQ